MNGLTPVRRIPRRCFVKGAVASASAMVLAACGEKGVTTRSIKEPLAVAATSTLHNSSVGHRRLAADFEFTPYQGRGFEDGRPVQFSEILARGKPVLLNVWAGLCQPCRVEMPDLQEVYEETHNRVTLIGLDVGPFVNLGTREEGQELVAGLGIEYPIGTTFDPTVLKDYRILGMPSSLFITPSGEVVRQWTGILNRESLLQLVTELEEASRKGISISD